MKPDIHEIVNALTTWHEQSGQKLVEVSQRYEAKIAKVQAEARAQAELPELSPLEDGEYYHFEYVQWNPIEDGGYYSNMADLADTREKALAKLRELIASNYVYAVHVRRFPMREQGVHVYDERKLPASQSNAYLQRLRADKLDKAYEELRTSKMKMEDDYERSAGRDEEEIQARDVVIQILLSHIEAAHRKLVRDNVACVVSDPPDYMRLLTPEGTEPSEEWANTLLRKARKEVRKRRLEAKAQELLRNTGQEADPADTDPGICRYACTHKVAFHGKDGCTYFECKCRATDVQEEPEDKAVECDCGITWKDGVMGPGHTDMQCYAMETPCRICGHDDDRHTRTLPEEGNQPYCVECDWSNENHEFDGSKPSPEDMCVCGCARKNHQGENDLGGAQCKTCPGDEERTWRHRFHMTQD